MRTPSAASGVARSRDRFHARTSIPARARFRAGFAQLVESTVEVAATLKAHGYSLVSEPRTTDARSSRLARFGGDGWLAAGDAAATFDPLSAQGIYFALYSGVAAGKALAAGDGAALERYEALYPEHAR